MAAPKNIPTNPHGPVKCGMIMPISDTEGYLKGHWQDVYQIVQEAVTPDFEARLVSYSDETRVIQESIVQNLALDPIAVCDVSSKNPNVMFELGMRLAFDKPTVVIKDDKTDYIFDTSVIEHVAYPHDLRFASIVAFKESLMKKVRATYEASKGDPNYSSFLKSFAVLKPKHLPSQSVEPWEFVTKALDEMRRELRNTTAEIRSPRAISVVPRKLDSPRWLKFVGPDDELTKLGSELGDIGPHVISMEQSGEVLTLKLDHEAPIDSVLALLKRARERGVKC